MQAIIKGGYNGGIIQVPPSKSMAHRALICSALTSGHSNVSGIIASEDMQATMRCLRLLGAEIDYDEQTCSAQISGAFSREKCADSSCENSMLHTKSGAKFSALAAPADCGESGSTLRFLIPLFSLTNAPVNLIGHGKLPQRPQHIYKQIFEKQGLVFEQNSTGVFINGALKSDEYIIDGSVSSQFISGLLFTLPLLGSDSTIKIIPPFESRSYVDLTICAMADFGVVATWVDNYTISIKGNQNYKPCNYSVEADSSQAAFWAVLAACASGAKSGQDSLPCTKKIVLKGMRSGTLQGDDVIFDILKECGANIDDTRKENGCITVYGSLGHLKGTEIDLANCPDLGPILTVLGLFCTGQTHIKNAARLRIKESDRIFAMECELKKLGIKISSDENNIYIDDTQKFIASRELASHGDHRIVMAICVAIVCAFNSLDITGLSGDSTDVSAQVKPCFECAMHNAHDINKSYPTFFEHLKKLGCDIEIV